MARAWSRVYVRHREGRGGREVSESGTESDGIRYVGTETDT